MDVPRLEAFLEVARLGSMRAASRSLHLGQPALSARIATLEDELGARVFERTKRGRAPDLGGPGAAAPRGARPRGRRRGPQRGQPGRAGRRGRPRHRRRVGHQRLARAGARGPLPSLPPRRAPLRPHGTRPSASPSWSPSAPPSWGSSGRAATRATRASARRASTRSGCCSPRDPTTPSWRRHPSRLGRLADATLILYRPRLRRLRASPLPAARGRHLALRRHRGRQRRHRSAARGPRPWRRLAALHGGRAGVRGGRPEPGAPQRCADARRSCHRARTGRGDVLESRSRRCGSSWLTWPPSCPERPDGPAAHELDERRIVVFIHRERKSVTPLRQATMSALNESLVLDHVREHEETSRPAIARDLGLSRASVSRIVGRLIQAELITESPQPADGRGRPAASLRFNTRAGCVLAIDLGGTNCHGVLADLAGTSPGRGPARHEHPRDALQDPPLDDRASHGRREHADRRLRHRGAGHRGPGAAVTSWAVRRSSGTSSRCATSCARVLARARRHRQRRQARSHGAGLARSRAGRLRLRDARHRHRRGRRHRGQRRARARPQQRRRASSATSSSTRSARRAARRRAWRSRAGHHRPRHRRPRPRAPRCHARTQPTSMSATVTSEQVLDGGARRRRHRPPGGRRGARGAPQGPHRALRRPPTRRSSSSMVAWAAPSSRTSTGSQTGLARHTPWTPTLAVSQLGPAPPSSAPSRRPSGSTVSARRRASRSDPRDLHREDRPCRLTRCPRSRSRRHRPRRPLSRPRPAVAA